MLSIKCSSLFFGLATAILAQGTVQISSVSAENATLDCVRHSTTKIAVQLAFTGIDARDKLPNICVRLSIYSAISPGNRLDIVVPEADVELRESPAALEFQAACSSDTRSGEVKVAAAIIQAPATMKIEQSAHEVTTLTISDHRKD